ncbi:hypothetical protein [Streptomyces sp. NPDC059744]|uniref:hypothetical protein n=1 Tax=Streptomyces sp. NPDC059744 TaxID=3346929 RepID=UPI003663EBA1
MASSARRRVQPISWWWALLAALVVAVVIVVTMWAMLAQADKLLGALRLRVPPLSNVAIPVRGTRVERQEFGHQGHTQVRA